MKTLEARQAAPRRYLGFALLAAGLAGCGDDSDSEDLPIPVPDTFEAYFVAGEVCMPSNVATGTSPGSAPEHPIRFDICRHRCISLDRGTATIRYGFQCAAGQCNMMIMAKAVAYRVQSETNCDGRELIAPPAGACTAESFTFSVDPPCCLDDNYMTGNMVVGVPFMDLEQAQKVSARVNAGEDPQTVILQEVGPTPAQRTWVVNYDTTHPVVSDGASLSGADCHTLAPP